MSFFVSLGLDEDKYTLHDSESGHRVTAFLSARLN